MTPDFAWTALSGAAQYELILDRVDLPEKLRLAKFSFTADSAPSINDICSGGVCSVNQIVFGTPLPGEGMYRWKVKSQGTYGKSRSSKSTFTVTTTASDTLPLPPAP